MCLSGFATGPGDLHEQPLRFDHGVWKPDEGLFCDDERFHQPALGQVSTNEPLCLNGPHTSFLLQPSGWRQMPSCDGSSG
jgi:hypothetical protein